MVSLGVSQNKGPTHTSCSSYVNPPLALFKNADSKNSVSFSDHFPFAAVFPASTGRSVSGIALKLTTFSFFFLSIKQFGLKRLLFTSLQKLSNWFAFAYLAFCPWPFELRSVA